MVFTLFLLYYLLLPLSLMSAYTGHIKMIGDRQLSPAAAALFVTTGWLLYITSFWVGWQATTKAAEHPSAWGVGLMWLTIMIGIYAFWLSIPIMATVVAAHKRRADVEEQHA